MQTGRRLVLGDTFVAAVLLIAALVELAAQERLTLFQVSVALGGTLPMVARRTRPLTVLVVLTGVLTILTIQGSDYFTFGELLALLGATYSVAAYCDRARALAGLALVLVGGLANSLRLPSPEVGDYLFPVLMLSGPWLAGRALRMWRQRARELEDLTRQLQEGREKQEELAAAAERTRIARDLHDIVAQSMNVMVIHAEAAEQALEPGPRHSPGQAVTSLRQIQSTGREALQATRDALGVLRDAGTPTLPRDLAHLDGLLDRVRATGLDVRCTIEGEREKLPPALEVSAYRIIEEALTNTLKHSHASTVSVALRYTNTSVELSIADDGASETNGTGGYGLTGMRERVSQFGGSLHAGYRPEGGYAVHAILPTT